MTPECETYIRENCTRYMLEIGLPANLQGFKYIRDAVMKVVEDPKLKRGVTKKLYPDIAKSYQVSVPVVERAMRHSIDVARTRGMNNRLNKIFCYAFCEPTFRPSGSEMVSILAERLSSDLEGWKIKNAENNI